MQTVEPFYLLPDAFDRVDEVLLHHLSVVLLILNRYYHINNGKKSMLCS